MLEKDKAKVEKTVPTVSRRLDDGTVIDLVYSPGTKRTSLAVCSAGVISVWDSFTTSFGERLVPVPGSNNLIRHRALFLAEKPEPFGSAVELVQAIDDYIFRYVDLSDQFRRIASYYVLLSWVHDAFNELPYLRLRGDFGSGKTRALSVIGSLCYKAFFASGASTVSPIFHTLDTFQGTLILDEADFRFSDEKSELVKILNNGNTKGFPVLRTAVTAKREFDPRAFSVFGPKIVAMRQSFEDPALESRFLTEEMGLRSLRDDIPINLPDRQKEEALALRNKLLSYRFALLPKIKVDDSLVDPTLSPRSNQILVPLLSIVDDEELRDEVRAVARFLEDAQSSVRSSSSEAQVLEVLFSLFAESDRSHVPVAEVTASMIEHYGGEYDRPLTHRYIGNILRKRLHLTTYKRHGVYVIPAAMREQVNILCKKYGVSEADPDIG